MLFLEPVLQIAVFFTFLGLMLLLRRCVIMMYAHLKELLKSLFAGTYMDFPNAKTVAIKLLLDFLCLFLYISIMVAYVIILGVH